MPGTLSALPCFARAKKGKKALKAGHALAFYKGVINY